MLISNFNNLTTMLFCYLVVFVLTEQTLPVAAEVIAAAAAKLQPMFAAIDKRTQINLKRVLDAYRRNQVSHLATLLAVILHKVSLNFAS
jgi:hypothetical protein